jgi:hypothetical protein
VGAENDPALSIQRQTIRADERDNFLPIVVL